ncbi:MAG TPA: hypothetical protein VNZ52_07605 [Candidatus Thermoplasmatota archaeon]|nr:hypothetical protein [Candidatus Thermoplasmatota archaeon]
MTRPLPPHLDPERGGRPTRWYDTIPPHLFLFCFVVVLGSVIFAPSLGRWTGDALYKGDVPAGGNITFTVPESGDTIHVDVTTTFARSPHGGHEAYVLLEAPSGETVFNHTIRVIPSSPTSDERNVRVLHRAPDVQPEETGTYRLHYIPVSGDPALVTLGITQGGLNVRHATSGLMFYTIGALFLTGLISLFFVKGGYPDGKGWDRFFPVRGATKLSLALTIVVALATLAALLVVALGGYV